ncbi:MAG: homing endonuclease associated repeat-containing protein [Lachnospiraceae bacterium]
MRLTKEKCMILLQEKFNETGRYPKKSDFSEMEVSMIKSYFGPWPRALEAAGVKAVKVNGRAEARKQKRIAVKRARNAERKNIKKQNVAEKKGKVEQ